MISFLQKKKGKKIRSSEKSSIINFPSEQFHSMDKLDQFKLIELDDLYPSVSSK